MVLQFLMSCTFLKRTTKDEMNASSHKSQLNTTPTKKKAKVEARSPLDAGIAHQQPQSQTYESSNLSSQMDSISMNQSCLAHRSLSYKASSLPLKVGRLSQVPLHQVAPSSLYNGAVHSPDLNGGIAISSHQTLPNQITQGYSGPLLAHTHKTTSSNSRGNEMAQGEGACPSAGVSAKREMQAIDKESSAVRHISSEQAPSPLNLPLIRRSPSTYHSILAKRGFIVKDNLGAGSYSKVKLAHYVKQADPCCTYPYPNEVAVKIIDRTIAPRDFQQKFLPRELEVWPNISHNHIVKMFEYFAEGHRVYMILEHVEGGDALRFIQNTGSVSEATGRIWVYQVADAVRYLHDLGIAHRDLKLENMLIDRENNIKICDFGFVKQCGESDLSKTFCGSKSYAAPEILKGEPYLPKKADVWAIGVILFILVVGRMPFDETKGNTSLLEEHRRLDLQWPRGKRAVSNQCRALSVFCLKFQWMERPSIHQVLSHSWFKMPSVPNK